MVIGVTLQFSSASSSPDMMTLQRIFEKAIVCFLFAPPELEEKALRRIMDIIDFSLKYRLMRESEIR